MEQDKNAFEFLKIKKVERGIVVYDITNKIHVFNENEVDLVAKDLFNLIVNRISKLRTYDDACTISLNIQMDVVSENLVVNRKDYIYESDDDEFEEGAGMHSHDDGKPIIECSCTYDTVCEACKRNGRTTPNWENLPL